MSDEFDPITARLIFETMGLEAAFELSYHLRDYPPTGDGEWVRDQLCAWLDES